MRHFAPHDVDDAAVTVVRFDRVFWHRHKSPQAQAAEPLGTGATTTDPDTRLLVRDTSRPSTLAPSANRFRDNTLST